MERKNLNCFGCIGYEDFLLCLNRNNIDPLRNQTCYFRKDKRKGMIHKKFLALFENLKSILNRSGGFCRFDQSPWMGLCKVNEGFQIEFF